MVPKDSRPARGDPPHDRFNAIFSMLSPAEFESWIQALHEATGGQVIAIDGMTLRGSFDEASNTSAIHMISAWASANSISLGQMVVDAKSYEITAIPKWVDMLQLKEATVTIDAAGCQTERNVSMTLRHLRDEISVAWDLDRAADSHVFGRVDPDLGCGL